MLTEHLNQQRSMMPLKKKVLSYVTRGNKILVMRHPHHPEVGVQVPGGTIQKGEEPEAAALRETTEESGLTGLRVIKKLGVCEYNMQPYMEQTHERHIYHLECDESTEFRESWTHYETHPDTGGDPIELVFEWLPLTGFDLGLAGGQGMLIDKLPTCESGNKGTGYKDEDLFYLDFKSEIASYRQLRISQISNSLNKLTGETWELDDSAKSPVEYAFIQHLFYRIQWAVKQKDRKQIISLVDCFFNREIKDKSTSKEPLILDRECCDKNRDENFDSMVYLLPMTVSNMASEKVIEVCHKGIMLARSVGFSKVFDDILGAVILLKKKPIKEATQSYTLSGLPGTIYIDFVDCPTRMGEIFLHESGHCWLNDALAVSGEELPTLEKWYSPWKQCKRPAYGVIHAVFVFSLMIQYFAKLSKDESVTDYGRAYCKYRLKVEGENLVNALPQFREVLEFVRSPLVKGVLNYEFNRALQFI